MERDVNWDANYDTLGIEFNNRKLQIYKRMEANKNEKNKMVKEKKEGE